MGRRVHRRTIEARAAALYARVRIVSLGGSDGRRIGATAGGRTVHVELGWARCVGVVQADEGIDAAEQAGIVERSGYGGYFGVHVSGERIPGGDDGVVAAAGSAGGDQAGVAEKKVDGHRTM